VVIFSTTPIDELLVNGKYRSTSSLRLRLIKDKVLNNVCYECGLLPEWNGKSLSLHLDHINGDSSDNRIDNLRILCPNCHSQTETYCGSKKKKERHAYKFVCSNCKGSKKSSKSRLCFTCNKKVLSELKTKVDWPEKSIIEDMVKRHGYVRTGKKFGVSDNAVRKFLKR